MCGGGDGGVGTKRIRSTHRGITADVLRHAGGFTDRVIHLIAEYARRRSLLGKVAGSASEHELAVDFIFLGVQHVAAFGTEAESNLLGRLLVVA